MSQMPVLNYGRRKRSLIIRIARRVVLILSAVALTWMTFQILKYFSKTEDPQMFEERHRFYALAALAREMITNNAAGVAPSKVTGHPNITTFDAFYDYVARNRPDLVAARDAPNPFPGILLPGAYGRAKSETRQDNDALIWSKKVYRRAVGKVQFRVNCSGDVEAILDDDAQIPRD